MWDNTLGVHFDLLTYLNLDQNLGLEYHSYRSDFIGRKLSKGIESFVGLVIPDVLGQF